MASIWQQWCQMCIRYKIRYGLMVSSFALHQLSCVCYMSITASKQGYIIDLRFLKYWCGYSICIIIIHNYYYNYNFDSFITTQIVFNSVSSLSHVTDQDPFSHVCYCVLGIVS